MRLGIPVAELTGQLFNHGPISETPLNLDPEPQ
jgi:hypothetical protein